MTSEELREGIFNLSPSRFGSITQVLIKRMVSLKKNRESLADLYGIFSSKNVDIKCTTARRKETRAISEFTLISCIEDALPKNRCVPFEKWADHDFECKIQQIKPEKLDILLYGVFFLDKFLLFKIDSEDIGTKIGYSPSESSSKTAGGVFYINPKTLHTHTRHFLYKSLSYDELLAMI